jgi:hypothetical protein
MNERNRQASSGIARGGRRLNLAVIAAPTLSSPSRRGSITATVQEWREAFIALLSAPSAVMVPAFAGMTVPDRPSRLRISLRRPALAFSNVIAGLVPVIPMACSVALV